MEETCILLSSRKQILGWNFPKSVAPKPLLLHPCCTEKSSQSHDLLRCALLPGLVLVMGGYTRSVILTVECLAGFPRTGGGLSLGNVLYSAQVIWICGGRPMILYFSATGNCKYVATRLVQSEKQEMLSIADCIRNGQYEFSDKTIGIISPTYDWGCRAL